MFGGHHDERQQKILKNNSIESLPIFIIGKIEETFYFWKTYLFKEIGFKNLIMHKRRVET